ncbi:MAG: tRNA (adenosine(37)-N6)-threonylcarbamoyltransferase complex dimerization subunit type 1 TsaB [Candidatus Margulisbacteria bacterium]|nr:tRNA (adenosine(37)-N6)-threonylcarbamoyltransferase complex dimerization subunit type 1 TsaB [Candidatus Margulisiibacteriota bacterium]
MLRAGISTVSQHFSVCLMDDEKVLSELQLYKESLDDLLDVLHRFFIEAGYTLDDVEEWVIVNGPGSYAGIRIGLSVIKTMAFVKNKPVKVVNTIELLAFQNRHYKGLIVAVMDSRKDEVNFGIYGGQPFNILLKQETIRLDVLLVKLGIIEGDYIIVGDLKSVPAEFEKHFFRTLPSAREAILLSFQKPVLDLAEVLPIYAYPVNISKGKA